MVSTFRWLAATTIATTIAATTTAVAATAVAATAVAATAAGAASAAPAPAAPGWRIAAAYPEHSQVGQLAAAGAYNAWAAESCTRPCHTGSGGLTLRHWNGRQWQVVADPAALSHTNGGIPLLAIAPGAKSEPWAIYPYAPDKIHPQAVAVRWTGKSWAAPTWLKKGSYISAVAAPSAAAVWAFGDILETGKPYVVRYNGTSWRAAPAPGIFVQGASAASATDIWTIGVRPGAAKGTWPMAVSHWNGTKWTASTLPRVPLPAGATAQPLSIVASGASAAWAFGYITGPGGTIVPNGGLILYRWNGTTWSQVTIPYKETEAFSIASDGHGGIWFWAAHSPGSHDFLIHDRNGDWTEVAVPRPASAYSAQADTIAAIPGTTSLWAAGWASVSRPQGTEGLILKYAG